MPELISFALSHMIWNELFLSVQHSCKYLLYNTWWFCMRRKRVFTIEAMADWVEIRTSWTVGVSHAFVRTIQPKLFISSFNFSSEKVKFNWLNSSVHPLYDTFFFIREFICIEILCDHLFLPMNYHKSCIRKQQQQNKTIKFKKLFLNERLRFA